MMTKEELRAYLCANLFDGVDAGTVTMQTSVLLDDVSELLAEKIPAAEPSAQLSSASRVFVTDGLHGELVVSMQAMMHCKKICERAGCINSGGCERAQEELRTVQKTSAPRLGYDPELLINARRALWLMTERLGCLRGDRIPIRDVSVNEAFNESYAALAALDAFIKENHGLLSV